MRAPFVNSASSGVRGFGLVTVHSLFVFLPCGVFMFIKFLRRARPLPYSLLRRALRSFIACSFISASLVEIHSLSCSAVCGFIREINIPVLHLILRLCPNIRELWHTRSFLSKYNSRKMSLSSQVFCLDKVSPWIKRLHLYVPGDVYVSPLTVTLTMIKEHQSQILHFPQHRAKLCQVPSVYSDGPEWHD